MRFEYHLRQLSKITGKTPQEISEIINETAQEVKVNSTEFLKLLFIRLGKLYPYGYYKIRHFLGSPITYYEVLRLFMMLEQLGLIEREDKVKGKGKFGLTVFKIANGKENHIFWKNPRKYYYQMRGWRSR